MSDRGSVIARLRAWMRGARRGSVDVAIDALLDPGFVAIDLETTGLDPRRDAIVSMAALPFVGGRGGLGYTTLVDPGRPIPVASTRIHGIDDQRVAGAPTVAAALGAFDAACAGRVLVGHDVAFDVAILARARRGLGLPQPDIPVLDTRRLAIALHPDWRHHAELETLATRLGIPVVGRHTAEGDARLAGAVLLALLPRFRQRGVATLGALAWAQTAAYRHARR